LKAWQDSAGLAWLFEAGDLETDAHAKWVEASWLSFFWAVRTACEEKKGGIKIKRHK
jgi:hypothetical protein